jgi:hypothetical protein
MTPSGIDPATFRFIAQCFNHCATACPHCIARLHTNYASFLLRSHEADAVCIAVRHTSISWDRSDSFFGALNSSDIESPWYDLSGNFTRSQGNTSITELTFRIHRLSTTSIDRTYRRVVQAAYYTVFSEWNIHREMFEVINVKRATTHWPPLGRVVLSLVQRLYCAVTLICVCVSSVQYSTGC